MSLDAGGTALTKREEECLGHLRQAETLGVSLKEYAQAYGVDVTFLYNTKSQLIKKGVVAAARPRPESDAGTLDDARSPFVAVQIADEAPPAPRKSALLFRLRHRSGHVLEFAAWPPADVLAMVLAEMAADAP